MHIEEKNDTFNTSNTFTSNTFYGKFEKRKMFILGYGIQLLMEPEKNIKFICFFCDKYLNAEPHIILQCNVFT